MVKPISREMYPTPPHPAWSHSQPPPPPPMPHPSWQGHPTMYHYGAPPPPPTSAPPPRHPPPRYPPPPHHRHPPRSRHPAYYHSRHPSPPPIVTASSPAAYATQPIHPALVTPQGPPQAKTPATPSSLPITHDPSMACGSNNSNNNSNLVTTKPPRPYTEYTMFYQLEREYILHRLLVDKNDPQAARDQEQQTHEALFKNDPLMPQRYRTLPLRADWYISGKSKKPSKRKHRKTHGKIGFLELTRMIAARWANVDEETRKYCKMMAAMELVKYKEDVESYNVYKARLEKMGEVPEDVKEKERKKRAKEKRAVKEVAELSHVSSSGAGAVEGKARTIQADRVKSDEALSSAASSLSWKPFHEASQENVDNDMERFITSLVHEDTAVPQERQRRDRKRSPSHFPPPPPPLPSSHATTPSYGEDPHRTSHMEAPWNHFMPGPRHDRRHIMPMHPPPPVPRAKNAALSSKVITPERSSKRRRLPVHRDARTNHCGNAAAYGAQPPPSETTSMIHSGPVSPDEDELIHMTFSGIDESEIAREFYFPSHAADGENVAETASTQEDLMPEEEEEEASHPPTEALYGPPLQSFDYWDALMEPTANQGGGGQGSERM